MKKELLLSYLSYIDVYFHLRFKKQKNGAKKDR
jgi:hypothetical protein